MNNKKYIAAILMAFSLAGCSDFEVGQKVWVTEETNAVMGEGYAYGKVTAIDGDYIQVDISQRQVRKNTELFDIVKDKNALVPEKFVTDYEVGKKRFDDRVRIAGSTMELMKEFRAIKPQATERYLKKIEITRKQAEDIEFAEVGRTLNILETAVEKWLSDDKPLQGQEYLASLDGLYGELEDAADANPEMIKLALKASNIELAESAAQKAGGASAVLQRLGKGQLSMNDVMKMASNPGSIMGALGAIGAIEKAMNNVQPLDSMAFMMVNQLGFGNANRVILVHGKEKGIDATLELLEEYKEGVEAQMSLLTSGGDYVLDGYNKDELVEASLVMLKNEMLRSTHEAAANELMEQYLALKGTNHDNPQFARAAIEAVEAKYRESSEKYQTSIPAKRYIDSFSANVDRRIQQVRERDDRAFNNAMHFAAGWMRNDSVLQTNLKRYLKEYPDGIHVDEANAKLAEIEGKKDDAAFKHAMKYEPKSDRNREWASKRFVINLKKYIANYPEGRHVAEAYAKIELETGEKPPTAKHAQEVTTTAPAVKTATPDTQAQPETAVKESAPLLEANKLAAAPAVQPPDQVSSLLASAQADLDAKRLLSPAGKNAYDKYQQVLALDKANAEAREGMKQIAGKYKSWANSALGKGAYSKANGYLDNAEKVTPGDPEIKAIRGQVIKAELAAQEKVKQANSEPEQDAVTKSLNNGLQAADNLLKGIFGN